MSRSDRGPRTRRAETPSRAAAERSGCPARGSRTKRKPPAGSTLPARGLRLAGDPGSSVSAPPLCDGRFPFSSPPGVSAIRLPRPPGAIRLHPATSQPTRTPPNMEPRPPRTPFPAPSALRPWLVPSRGRPLAGPASAPRPPPVRLLSAPSLPLADHHINAPNRASQHFSWPNGPKSRQNGPFRPENGQNRSAEHPRAPTLHPRCLPEHPRWQREHPRWDGSATTPPRRGFNSGVRTEVPRRARGAMRSPGAEWWLRRWARLSAPHLPDKKEAPGGQHTTRSGASSRWRSGELRFGAAIVRRPVPLLFSARRLRHSAAPASRGNSAASSDLAADADSTEHGTAPASDSVSGALGAEALARALPGSPPGGPCLRPPPASGAAPFGSVPSAGGPSH